MTATLPPRRRRRTWPQRLLIAFNLLLIVGCLATAGVVAYLYDQVADIPRVELGTVLTAEPEASGEPQNFLLVGVDSGEGLDPDDPVLAGRDGPLRSDTIMVLRVDPESERAWMLSLPRDLWVPIAGSGGSQRINTAIQAGPGRLIETIEDAFNIPIHHYVQVDFLGFRELVDTIDGVPVYFPEPVRDRDSGLVVQEPGCVTLDPVHALAYARSRHYEVFQDGRWRTDGTGDLGRISRQQDFIRRALQRAIERGARNPAVLNRLIDTGTERVTVDDRLTPADLIALGRRFRSFNPETLDLYSVPVVGDVVQGADILRLQTDAAQPIFDVFRGLTGDELGPASVAPLVANGTGEAGLAGVVADDLRRVGFSVPPGVTPDADRFDYERTTILVPTGAEAAADLLERYLVAGAELRPVAAGEQLTVIAGADYAGVLDQPRPAAAATTSTLPATSTTAPGETVTTTTVVGEVPMAPPGVDC